jgi:hypothetical protein
MLRELNCPTICGFSTPGNILIYDEQGKFLEYNKPVQFNLPPGIYWIVQGMAAALPAPVQYDRLPLIARQKFNQEPADITFYNSKQTYKAKTNMLEGDIYTNPDWSSTLTTPEQTFVILHEAAHRYYIGNGAFKPDLLGEVGCDLLAADTMLQNGFNPLQTAIASLYTLDQSGITSNVRTEIILQILKTKSHA